MDCTGHGVVLFRRGQCDYASSLAQHSTKEHARCAGTEAALSFTLAYAAPEVVAAYEAQHATHVVSPASDVWSLGAIAFEMLTGEALFGPFTPPAEVLACIAGREPMPWEGPRRATLLARLHVFRANVLECLHRDPALRPPMASVVRGWEHLFHSATTATTHGVARGRTVT
jgi:serine/threonine protein kinase